MTLRLRDVSKRFQTRAGEVKVLDGVSLEVPQGRMTVVVGPSGSGKTTLLRCVAGLEELDGGSVEVAGRDVTSLDPGERDVAMVFQDYALYPHLSVRANIAFGLRARKVARDQIDAKVEQAASMVGLDAQLDRSPDRLSGGERQRVALARALVRRPAAFLLDEPLSNLDAELRTQTRSQIRSLQRSLDTTTIYVTHDQVEAMTMGDSVAVLRAGRVEQVGPPMELYERPSTAFVAGFLGSPPMNLFPSRLLGRDGDQLCGVRPERVDLVATDDARLHGEIAAVEPIGGEVIVHVRVGDCTLLVRRDLRGVGHLDGTVGLGFGDDDLHRFSASSGQRLP